MTLAILFWILFILAAIFSVVGAPSPFNWRTNAATLLLFVLVGIVGWHVFGPAIHG